VLAASAGLTISWHTAVYATVILLAIRVLEDYLVIPRVLGGAVGLSPLVVLISVSAAGILLGGFYILLAIPIASLLVTLADVTIRGIDPAEATTPAVLFTPKENESVP
jgi:predicted PurR-regulated permease PerM